MEGCCMLSAQMYNPLAQVTEPHTQSPGYAEPYLEVCILWHDTVTIVHQAHDGYQCSQNCTGSRLGSLKAGITKSNTLQFHCKCQTSTSKIERWLKIENKYTNDCQSQHVLSHRVQAVSFTCHFALQIRLLWSHFQMWMAAGPQASLMSSLPHSPCPWRHEGHR